MSGSDVAASQRPLARLRIERSDAPTCNPARSVRTGRQDGRNGHVREPDEVGKNSATRGETDTVEHKVSLISPPDRERRAAEVMVDGEQLAEVSYDTDTPMLELYPRSDGHYWQLDCDEPRPRSQKHERGCSTDSDPLRDAHLVRVVLETRFRAAATISRPQAVSALPPETRKPLG